MALENTYVNRGYQLIIGDYKNDPNNATLIDNLQITFDVTKTNNDKARGNQATIEVYNLDDDTLALLDKEFIAADFHAGYYNTEIKRLFAGEVAGVYTRKQGTDIVTQIRMGAAYSSLNHQILSHTIPPGWTRKQALEYLVTQVKGLNGAVITGDKANETLLDGYPMTGSPRAIFQKLCEDGQMDCAFDNGKVYVGDKGKALTSTSQALLISPDTGLIDLAYKVAGEGIKKKKDPSKQPGIMFTCNLNADIIPGYVIKLEQDTPLDGWWKIESVRFSGSWRSGQWVSECRCSQIKV